MHVDDDTLLIGGNYIGTTPSFSIFPVYLANVNRNRPESLLFSWIDIRTIIQTLQLMWIICEFASTNWNNMPDGKITDTRDFLLQLGLSLHPISTTDTFPEELLRKDSFSTENRTHNKKKATRRGKKKGGIKARLERETGKLRVLPSIILANVRSRRRKTDRVTSQR